VLLVGDLDRLLLFDIEHVARFLLCDALRFKGELDADALTLHGVAVPELRCFERFGSRDLAALCILIRPDPLGGDCLFLRDAGGFNRLARLDVRLLQRLCAHDLPRPHFLVLGDTVRLDFSVLCDAPVRRAPRRDLRSFEVLVARNLEPSRLAIGRDRLGGRRLLLGDARRTSRLQRRDLGLLDGAAARDLLGLRYLLALNAGERDVFSWAIRAASMASRAAISASARARLQAISGPRMRSSCAIRVASVD
jgi:hypothetical protein